jgi:hypothetical protein
MGREHFGNHFATTGRIGGDQHPTRKTGQEIRQWRERLGRARIKAEGGCGTRWKIMAAAGGRGRCIAYGYRAEALDLDLAVLAQQRQHFAWWHEGFFGGQQRPLDVVAPLLVTLGDVLPGRLEGCADIDVGGDHHVLGQVVAERGGGIEEQRQIELDARWGHALADAAVDALARHIALEARAIAAPEATHRLGIERDLARRQQAHRFAGCQ